MPQQMTEQELDVLLQKMRDSGSSMDEMTQVVQAFDDEQHPLRAIIAGGSEGLVQGATGLVTSLYTVPKEAIKDAISVWNGEKVSELAQRRGKELLDGISAQVDQWNTGGPRERAQLLGNILGAAATGGVAGKYVPKTAPGAAVVAGKGLETAGKLADYPMRISGSYTMLQGMRNLDPLEAGLGAAGIATPQVLKWAGGRLREAGGDIKPGSPAALRFEARRATQLEKLGEKFEDASRKRDVREAAEATQAQQRIDRARHVDDARTRAEAEGKVPSTTVSEQVTAETPLGTQTARTTYRQPPKAKNEASAALEKERALLKRRYPGMSDEMIDRVLNQASSVAPPTTATPISIEKAQGGFRLARPSAPATPPSPGVSPASASSTGASGARRTPREVVEEYAKGRGMGAGPHEPVQVDPSRARRIADAYDQMPDSPTDPAVQKSYTALRNEISDQFEHLQKSGLKAEPWTKPGQPYKTSAEMAADIEQNNHLYYSPTEKGFGEASGHAATHPLLQKGRSGLPANDELRVVHDYFAHASGKHQFGPRGEENAWMEHLKTLSPEAQKALTTETRGQNSWVNFGPQMRDEAGNLIPKGDPRWLAPEARAFAPQKAGLLPEEFFSPGGAPPPAPPPAAPGALRMGAPVTEDLAGVAPGIRQQMVKQTLAEGQAAGIPDNPVARQLEAERQAISGGAVPAQMSLEEATSLVRPTRSSGAIRSGESQMSEIPGKTVSDLDAAREVMQANPGATPYEIAVLVEQAKLQRQTSHRLNAGLDKGFKQALEGED